MHDSETNVHSVREKDVSQRRVELYVYTECVIWWLISIYPTNNGTVLIYAQIIILFTTDWRHSEAVIKALKLPLLREAVNMFSNAIAAPGI